MKTSPIRKGGISKTAALNRNNNARKISKPFDAASFFNKENSKKIKEIAEKYGLDLVLLFGSQASGKTHFASDIDIAILAKKSISFDEELKIQYEFTKVFKTDIVDIVDIRKSGPLLMHQIFSKPHEIMFCGDLQIYFRYKIYATKRYIEAKPLFELTQKSISNFLEERKERI